MNSKYLNMNVLRVLALTSLLLLVSAGLASAQANIQPDTVDQLIFPGEDFRLGKTVTTPEIPPKPDIYFLADTTGSMVSVITQVKSDAATLVADISAVTSDPRFGAGDYKDFPYDAYAFKNAAPITDDDGSAALTAIGGWTAGGGADGSEAQFYALDQIAKGVVNWRTDSTKIVVWFGDAPGHDPVCSAISGLSYDIDESSLITELVAQEIRVIAIGTTTGYTDALNDDPTLSAGDYSSFCTIINGSAGQADRIAAATGGVSMQDVAPEDIATAILEGLGNLPALVAMESDCSAPIGTLFAPDNQEVISGDDAIFTETITVEELAAGGTYSCSDWATINGEVMVDESDNKITEDKSIHVPGIVLEPETDVNELGFDLSHTVLATVSAGSYGPVENVRVEFSTSGQNAGLGGEGFTDTAGEVEFTYSPPVVPDSLGSDTIEACFTDAGDTKVYGCDAVAKDWVDTTPPVAACTPSVNPHGKEPNAPGSAAQGQNQDGFYLISAEDVVWPDDALEVFVTDSGSGTVFGPFPVGTNIKYVEDAYEPPYIRPMGGNNGEGKGNALEVEWFIKGNGDAIVTAVDSSGNVSDGVYCLVPPPPK